MMLTRNVRITLPKGMTLKIDGMPVELVADTEIATHPGNSESIHESIASYESEYESEKEDSPGNMQDVGLDKGEGKKCLSGDVCGTSSPDPYSVRMVHPGTGEVKTIKARVTASAQSSEVMPSPVAGASFELEKAEAQAAGFVSLDDIDSKELSFLLLSKLNEPKQPASNENDVIARLVAIQVQDAMLQNEREKHKIALQALDSSSRRRERLVQREGLSQLGCDGEAVPTADIGS